MKEVYSFTIVDTINYKLIDPDSPPPHLSPPDPVKNKNLTRPPP